MQIDYTGKRVITDLGEGVVIDKDYDGELVIQLDNDVIFPDYAPDGIIMRFVDEITFKNLTGDISLKS